MKETIRDLENMPIDIKLAYTKLLSFMALTDNNYNQLKLTALYRIINKIKLSSSERVQFISSIFTNEISLNEILNEIESNQELNDQEKNIFRFSLMKDLIIIMNADYIETDDEKKLLKNIQNHFNITDEQLSFFKEEYELDRYFFKNQISHNKFNKIAKNTVSAAVSLGIPLTVIYHSGSFKGLGLLGTISGLKTLGMKKRTGRHSLAIGLSKSIALGVITYKAVEYILHVRKDEKTKISQLMKENMEALHDETIDSLYYDIEYFTNRMYENKRENEHLPTDILKIIDTLEAVLATLENTEAIMM